MRNTIAFDHENGFWKSRYTFVSSCYGWIKKVFVSAQTIVKDTKALWIHDETSNINNSFYGRQPSPSLIAVTFNDSPSQMKIFKAMSLESTDFRSLQGGVNTFRTNSGTSQTRIKNVKLAPMKEKGGVVYGHVPTVEEMSMSDFELAGVISSEALEVPSGLESLISAPPAGSSYEYYTLGMRNPSARSVTSSSDEFAFSEAGDSCAVRNPLAAYNDEEYGVPYIFPFEDGILVMTTPDNEFYFEVGDPVYILTKNKVNSDQARGFYAEAEILLGNQNFELFSINLEYENNPLGPNG